MKTGKAEKEQKTAQIIDPGKKSREKNGKKGIRRRGNGKRWKR